MNEIKIECPNCKKEVDVGKIIGVETKNLYEQLEKKNKIEKENINLHKYIDKQNLLSISRESEIKQQAKLDAEKNKAEEIVKVKQQAKLDAEKELQETKDKISKEKELLTRRLRKKIKEVEGQFEQKSPEVQGEIQEELIEDFVTRKFPIDNLVTIKKGKNGADSLLNILSSEGKILARILIESKNTKDFSNKWVPKILEDMINVEADAGIIISKVLPSSFPKDELWDKYHGGKVGLVPFKYGQVYSLIEMLRSNIINSKKSNSVDKTSRDLKKLWDCITGPKFTAQFRHMFSVLEKMKEQLEKLKTTVNKQMADQHKNIELIQNTQREWLYDIVKSVGEDKLPIELTEFDEEKK